VNHANQADKHLILSLISPGVKPNQGHVLMLGFQLPSHVFENRTFALPPTAFDTNDEWVTTRTLRNCVRKPLHERFAIVEVGAVGIRAISIKGNQ
jgi:hypothetical protein